eukprot:gnl/TRDRNA2_/TRDRNA2_48199_c0_seq1.p1 gnl/TRDRNA2_/TRDRNA2_48199_c0~~gnl/TRDRNA2_/TRDRNA2_48199_c0_seq1.p1  ORF type:complete len:162 (+),score=32.35 gnl/TRDRNA2_/TRDRNA2_48199_c0_seq1:103-588(+)
MPSSVEKLDEDDLDEEDRAILREVSRKGYYHGRPKNSETAPPPPQRIDSGAPQLLSTEGGPQPIDAETAAKLLASSGRHSDHDAFQKKWDRFDNDDVINKCIGESSTTSNKKSSKAKKSSSKQDGDIAALLAFLDPLITVVSKVSGACGRVCSICAKRKRS